TRGSRTDQNARSEHSRMLGHGIRQKVSLTPRGKLRACPCSGSSALLYEPRPSSAHLPCTPVSFTAPVMRLHGVKAEWPARRSNSEQGSETRRSRGADPSGLERTQPAAMSNGVRFRSRDLGQEQDRHESIVDDCALQCLRSFAWAEARTPGHWGCQRFAPQGTALTHACQLTTMSRRFELGFSGAAPAAL